MQNVHQPAVVAICVHQISSFGRIDIFFFPVKAEIEEKKMVEISTGNTPEISTGNTSKSTDFQGKTSFFDDIVCSEISTVEISGGNKNLIFEKFRSRRCVLHFESISKLKNSLLWLQAKFANICIFPYNLSMTSTMILYIRKPRLEPQERVFEL